MNAGTLCVRKVLVTRPGASLQDAARVMAEEQVGSLVVVDELRTPIGLLTDRDLVVRGMAKHKDPTSTTVDTVMSQAPSLVGESDPLEEVISIMRRDRVRRVPVVGDDGRLVGLVSLDDVLSQLSKDLSEVGRLIDAQATEPEAPLV